MEISTLAMMGIAGAFLLAKEMVFCKKESPEKKEGTERRQLDRPLCCAMDDGIKPDELDATCNENVDRSQ